MDTAKLSKTAQQMLESIKRHGYTHFCAGLMRKANWKRYGKLYKTGARARKAAAELEKAGLVRVERETVRQSGEDYTSCIVRPA